MINIVSHTVKLFRYFVILAVIILFWSPFAFSLDNKTIEESRAIALSDWSVRAISSVVDGNFQKSDIESFAARIDDIASGRVGQDILIDETDLEKPAKFYLEYLDSYKWQDIDNDGTYEFLAIVVHIRGINQFYVVKRINSTFKIQAFDLCYNKYLMEDIKNSAQLDGILEDINKDGKLELIIPVPEPDNIFAPCWPTIYKWNGKKFEDASQSFKDYYRNVLLPQEENHIFKLQTEIE